MSESEGMLAEELRYSTRIMVGGALLECFIAKRAFVLDISGVDSSFTEEHVHACFELLYCKSGSGIQFLGNCGNGYGERSLFVFSPFMPHAHISDGKEREVRYSIRFELTENQPPGETHGYAKAVFDYLKNEGNFHFIADDAVDGLVARIADVVINAPPCADLLLGGLLSALFAHVFREIYLEAYSGTTHKTPARLANNAHSRKFIIDFFFDHLMDGNARMETLCAQVHLSPSQLNRVIKEIFGTTFKQKLIDVRLCYIKYFLKFSDLSIGEIAQRTNFAEDSNFSLFFKQHCGMSPTQYRRAEREVRPRNADG